MGTLSLRPKKKVILVYRDVPVSCQFKADMEFLATGGHGILFLVPLFFQSTTRKFIQYMRRNVELNSVKREKQVLLIGLIQFQTIKTHLWHNLFGSKNAVAESFLANSMSGVKYVRR